MTEKNYSIQDVYQRIEDNKNLRKVVDGLKGERWLGSEENLLQWWYDPSNKALKGKSPDEFCREWKKKS